MLSGIFGGTYLLWSSEGKLLNIIFFVYPKRLLGGTFRFSLKTGQSFLYHKGLHKLMHNVRLLRCFPPALDFFIARTDSGFISKPIGKKLGRIRSLQTKLGRYRKLQIFLESISRGFFFFFCIFIRKDGIFLKIVKHWSLQNKFCCWFIPFAH